MSKRLSDAEIERQDWRESRQLVMRTLERVEGKLDGLDNKVGSEMSGMKVELATIKTKVAFYAAIVSIIGSALISVLVSYLSKR